MPHFVYILQSLKDKKYNIGETFDVAARLVFHKAGKNTLQKIVLSKFYSVIISNTKATKTFLSVLCGFVGKFFGG